MAARVRRVVSLVPSLTEAIAWTEPDALVGRTQWCSWPAGLTCSTVRGTKNPDVAAIATLAPDVVVVSVEENRRIDVERLRERGVEVWVTDITGVDDACDQIEDMVRAFGWAVPGWLDDVRREWADPTPPWLDVCAWIWRDPWLAVGRDTFASDVLARIGARNVVGQDRYPALDPASVRADLHLLTSEPYAFTPADVDTFPGRATLADGRQLEWYGPSLRGARERLTAALRAATA